MLLLFRATEIDLCCQDPLYSAATRSWAIPKSAPLPRLLLYKAPKYLLILFGIWLLASATVPSRAPVRRFLSQRPRRELLYLLVCLGLFPASIASLKQISGIRCPSALSRYGGEYPYRHLFTRGATAAERRGNCFPAGHASGGFALLGLCYVARTRRGQWAALALTLSVGWGMGLYQMLNGSHFLSHTVVTMWLAWIFALAAALLFRLPTPGGSGGGPGRA